LRPIKRSRQISDGLNLIASVDQVMALSLGLMLPLMTPRLRLRLRLLLLLRRWNSGAVVRWGGGGAVGRRGGAAAVEQSVFRL